VLNNEELLTTIQIAATIPGTSGAKQLNPSTILRWITDGAVALSGRRVKLEAVRVGGRWLTSKPALERFSAALSDSDRAQTGERTSPT